MEKGQKCKSKSFEGGSCLFEKKKGQNKTLFIERGRNAFSFGKWGKNAIYPKLVSICQGLAVLFSFVVVVVVLLLVLEWVFFHFK